MKITQAQIDANERNRETSAREVSEFKRKKPKRYFAYVNVRNKTLTTWMGDTLGRVYFGSEYRSNMGDIRQTITVDGINGVRYYGIYFKSSGDYARLRAFKGQ